MSNVQAADALPTAACAPKLVLSEGRAEALKWLAVVSMTVDHINKYVLNDAYPGIFAFGRLAFPLFGLVLAWNLARPGGLEKGVQKRLCLRLATVGTIASVPFIALGGLGWGWWPLNVMFTWLAATMCVWLYEGGGPCRLALATGVFLIAGGFVEFWWPGLAMCIAAWVHFRKGSWWTLGALLATTASLHLINKSQWALLAIAIVIAMQFVPVRLSRAKYAFYVFYPLHLAALLVVTLLTQHRP